MLTIKECRKYLKKYTLSNKQIEELRDNMYSIVDVILEDYITNTKDKAKSTTSGQDKK
ncbi:hypothetical protein KJ855_02815 [Patescibacteria group bacterium]|nr:hypothetical protein [Patescibacteria group bacterium]